MTDVSRAEPDGVTWDFRCEACGAEQLRVVGTLWHGCPMAPHDMVYILNPAYWLATTP